MEKFKVLVGFRTMEGDFEVSDEPVEIPEVSAKEGLRYGWIKSVGPAPKNKSTKPRSNKGKA